MILLILVAALWIAVLAPRAWRRIAESGGVGSVDHFHHQLELLEHAGPKLVRPAYRLRSGEAGAGPTTSVSSRPKLVLLRAVDDERAADIDGVDGAHYARVGVIQRPEESVSPAQTPSEMAAYRRQLARRRCTLVLRLLAATALSTGILGVLPAMRLAWIFTGITGVAALALAGMIAYAREIESQQAERRHRRVDHGPTFDGGGPAPLSRPARSGLPGWWDEDGDGRWDGNGDVDFDFEASPPERRVATGG